MEFNSIRFFFWSVEKSSNSEDTETKLSINSPFGMWQRCFNMIEIGSHHFWFLYAEYEDKWLMTYQIYCIICEMY